MELNIGPNNRYVLSQRALTHILIGDLSDRQNRPSGSTVLTKIIAGGLHTLDGWRNFLTHRPDIKHGLFFEPNLHEDWYYARELQNNVILLKVPRSALQSGAANLTKFPDTYYKSGYLWKTLFPKHFDQTLIVNAIDEALKNQDNEETSTDLIVGYSNKSDLFKALKIRVQLQGNLIQSAFPTWSQPMTGNNGKPYSHIDSINTVVAFSSVFALNEKSQIDALRTGWTSRKFLDSLKEQTPRFLSSRYQLTLTESREYYRSQRRQELQKAAAKLTQGDAIEIKNLCLSDIYSRYPFMVMMVVYETTFEILKRDGKYKNAVDLYQNLEEMLEVLSLWDTSNGTKYAFDVVTRLLSIRFLVTGGLDQWQLKRLSNQILAIICRYNDTDVKVQFLNVLATSPIRIAFYTEFNLNQYFVLQPELIGFSEYGNHPLLLNHFYEFVAQNLGINYTANFDDNFNIKMAQSIQDSVGRNAGALNLHQVRYSLANDFNLFGFRLVDVCSSLTLTSEIIKTIDNILYDYYRCLAANMLRVIVKHHQLLSEEYEFGSADFLKATKAKHEYKFFIVMLQKEIIGKLAKLYLEQGFKEESKQLEAKYGDLASEIKKIPLPKRIPKFSDL